MYTPYFCSDNMALLGLLFLLFSAATLVTFVYVQNIQETPYMDEIFHVPQAKKYCAGNFTEWDPMITTLPGLYLASVGVLKPVAVLMNVALPVLCRTAWLRAVNVLFTLGNFYLIYSLMKRLHNPILDADGVKLYMSTLALSLFPVLYFFTFLYYTDAGSTFFVLFMYLYSLHDNHVMAAIFGVISVLFRQTNIAWVVFTAGLSVRKHLLCWMKTEKQDLDIGNLSDYDTFRVTIESLFYSALHKQASLYRLMQNILREVWCYLLVGVGFAVFAHVNEGIVVGDRSHHTVCFNLPQLFYFICVANGFACVYTISPYKCFDFMKFCYRHPVRVGAFIAVAAVVVQNFTYEHEYLLADNRHYTFYIWSRIYRRHQFVKFALIPVYLYGAWSFFSALQYREVFWKLVYFISVMLTAVPQKLLELRYFILPYLIFRLNMKYGTATALLHEILLVVLVNVATIYMFTEKPFKWSNSDEIMRFIW